MVAGSVAIQPASVVCGSRVFPRAGVLYSAGGPTSSDFSSLAALNLGLIRFGGHLPKGEYDVDHDGHEGQADAAELHG